MENKKKYWLSRWCKWFSRNGNIAFLHSITLALMFLPESIGQKIISSNFIEIDSDILEEFRKEKLIVDSGHDDMQELFDIREQLSQDNKNLEIMYLMLTDFCNLKCKYCFEETPLSMSKPVPPVMMNIATVNFAVSAFADLTTKYGRKGYKRVINLYGGEPLLNIPGVKATVEKVNHLKKIKQMPDECEVAIVTNGVLLDEDIIQFFAKHKVTVGISIDGPGYINNLYRIPKEGVDVFPRIMENYRLLQKYSVGNGVSATLTPEVVDNFDEVLSFLINELGIRDGISFNILHYNPNILLDDDYFDKAADCLIYAFEKFRELNVYEERMMRKIKSFIDRKTMFTDCGAMSNQIVVAPDGLVGICQDFLRPRKYFDELIFDTDFNPYYSIFGKWENRSPLFMSQCFDCEALGICGGGCPASAELKTGNAWNIDDRVCSHSKKSLEWLIWDTFSQSITS